MLKWTLIAFGGAAGSLLRYLMQGCVQNIFQQGAHSYWLGLFPVGTLAVNVLGCAVIGFLAALFDGAHSIREEYRVGLTAGVLGGFTTFSAFGAETFRLIQNRAVGLAALNVALSCCVGLLAVWGGYRLAEHWFAN